jgi:soluble lytic murein transglycosylase-like protein
VSARLLGLAFLAVVGGVAASAVAGTSSPPPREAVRELAARPPARVAAAQRSARCPIPARFRPAFVSAARDAGLPLAMLVAVARVESGLRPNAVSSAGARGLLQLLPSTAASLALDPHRPATNVLAGARYLRLMLDRFRSTELALAAYNAGPTAVARAGGAPSAVTLRYVRDVTSLWRALNGCG